MPARMSRLMTETVTLPYHFGPSAFRMGRSFWRQAAAEASLRLSANRGFYAFSPVGMR
jgi:hypothetical protein